MSSLCVRVAILKTRCATAPRLPSLLIALRIIRLLSVMAMAVAALVDGRTGTLVLLKWMRLKDGCVVVVLPDIEALMAGLAETRTKGCKMTAGGWLRIISVSCRLPLR